MPETTEYKPLKERLEMPGKRSRTRTEKIEYIREDIERKKFEAVRKIKDKYGRNGMDVNINANMRAN